MCSSKRTFTATSRRAPIIGVLALILSLSSASDSTLRFIESNLQALRGSLSCREPSYSSQAVQCGFILVASQSSVCLIQLDSRRHLGISKMKFKKLMFETLVMSSRLPSLVIAPDISSVDTFDFSEHFFGLLNWKAQERLGFFVFNQRLHRHGEVCEDPVKTTVGWETSALTGLPMTTIMTERIFLLASTAQPRRQKGRRMNRRKRKDWEMTSFRQSESSSMLLATRICIGWCHSAHLQMNLVDGVTSQMSLQ